MKLDLYEWKQDTENTKVDKYQCTWEGLSDSMKWQK